MKLIRNDAAIFTIFSHDQPDRTGSILQKIGIVSFSTTFFATMLAYVLEHRIGKDSLIFNVLAWAAAVGWIVGIFAFVATGTHYAGKAKGERNFLSSSVYVLGRTFLYVLLPSIIIAALLIAWAVITKQPAFS
jgi:hypothetical protein